MGQTVYIDILFILNLIINYFLLLLTAKATKITVKRRRLLLGAAVGAVFALLIFFPEIHILSSILAKLVFSVAIVLVTFGFSTLKRTLKILAAFYISNFIFAGIMLALWFFLAPPGLVMNNGVVYFYFSPILLVLGATASYVILALLEKFTKRKSGEHACYNTQIKYDQKSVDINSLVDTGNSLCDIISGKPIMLAEYKKVKNILPSSICTSLEKNNFGAQSLEEMAGEAASLSFRLIPYKSVGGEGLLPAFRPDEIIINGKNEKFKFDDIFVAISNKRLSDGQFQALLNPELVEKLV